jgi:hypothetical protein
LLKHAGTAAKSARARRFFFENQAKNSGALQYSRGYSAVSGNRGAETTDLAETRSFVVT